MKLLRLLLLFVFTFFLFGAGESKEKPVPAWQTKTVALRFSATPYSAVTIISIQAEFSNAEGVVVKRSEIDKLDGISPEADDFKIGLYQILNSLDNGIYSVRVRVFDDGGSVSPWSNVLWFKKGWKELPAPLILPPVTQRGDVNGDGKVDVADISALVNYLY